MIKPLGINIVLEKFESKVELPGELYAANGSVLVPKNLTTKDFKEMVVIAVADAVKDFISIGDKVLVSSYVNKPVYEADGKEYLVLTLNDIYGIV